MFIKGIFLGTFVLFSTLILCSCGKESKVGLEKEDSQFQAGQRYYKEGRYQESMSAFLGVIEKRRDAPESHFEVGRLYLEYFKDPIAAIYHLRKFLEAKPNVEQSPMIRQMIERAKKNFAQTLPGRPLDDEISRLDFMDMLKRTQDENLQLKKLLHKNQISFVDKPKRAEETITFVPKKANIAPGLERVKSYTVVSGDTLLKISNKIYGSSTYWELIYKANSDSLKTPHDLKVGQVLKIPQKTS